MASIKKIQIIFASSNKASDTAKIIKNFFRLVIFLEQTKKSLIHFLVNQKTVEMMSDFADKTAFANNWRNVQDLGNRTVTFYSADTENSAQTASLTCFLAALIYGQL